MKKITAVLLAMVILLIPTLTSCGRDEESPYVVLSKANVVLSVGDEYTLGATVHPDSKSHLPIEWETNNPNVVTCEGGRLKAKAVGSAVVRASVNGGNAFSARVKVTNDATKHVNMIVGEVITIAEHEYNNIFTGEFSWMSSDPTVAEFDNGVITAASVGNAVIRMCQGDDAVTLYSISVFENINSMVDFTAPELPMSLSYKSGISEVEVMEFSYTLEEDKESTIDRLLVTYTITYKKTADISGSESRNRTGFYVELYSEEVGFCKTYTVESDFMNIGQTAVFSSQFYADISSGMRHFNIVLVPIEN